jgi:hypothetical protein
MPDVGREHGFMCSHGRMGVGVALLHGSVSSIRDEVEHALHFGTYVLLGLSVDISTYDGYIGHGGYGLDVVLLLTP